MSEGKSIFDDRRIRLERRRQELPMPASLNRRSDDRRQKSFSARAWWLDTDYAVELVRERKAVVTKLNSSEDVFSKGSKKPK